MGRLGLGLLRGGLGENENWGIFGWAVCLGAIA